MDTRVNRRPARLLLLLLPLSSTIGCYRYHPVVATSVPAGANVRLMFSDDGARLLRDAAGMELRQLDGRVARTLADTAVIVKPDAVVTRDGDELAWRRGELTVPLRAIDRSQERRIDRRRSGGVAVAIAAVFSGVVYFALKSIGAGGGNTLQPGTGVPE